MNTTKSIIVRFTAAILLWAAVLHADTSPQGEASLEWKNYVIRLDRGWDILCEPYEIQPDDWVLKIFAQKGEISNVDFREFLSIFSRLNPHVKDIDRVRPGQIIDIPLKKLAQGSLQGQSSGIVTIPFVSLNSVDDVLSDYSNEYTIKPGDCVSVILARRFGIYESSSYAKSFKIFQALNPDIKDVNRITAGQKIYLPAPSIQQQPWYDSMFDSQGNLTNKIGMAGSNSAPNIPIGQGNASPLDGQQSQQTLKNSLVQATAALEGKLIDKGTAFFPLSSGKDFELDLSRYPILEKQNGERYILTDDNKIMGEDIELLKTILPDITIIKLSKKQTTDQVIDSIITDQNADPNATGLKISEHGTEIWLQAKWIETIESQGDDIPQRICIMPIESVKERTDPSISRYLLQHNVIIKEVLSTTGSVISAESAASDISARYTIVTSLAASDNKQLVSEFAKIMQWRFSPDVSITFPYAEVQVKALSNMLSSGQGREALIDFEDLYGDAISAIEQTGLKVIQIQKDDLPATVITKLFKAMNTAYSENPAFMAAQRVSPYNTAIEIKGFLLDNQNSQKILLSTNSLNQKVVEFLESTGLKVILLGQSKLFY